MATDKPKAEPKAKASAIAEVEKPRFIKPVPPPDKKTAPALRITSRPVKGFWRAGRRWGSEPTTILLSDLSKEQAKQLRDEKMLVVEELLIEVD